MRSVPAGSAGERTPGRREPVREGSSSAAGSAANPVSSMSSRAAAGGRLAPLDAARDEMPVAELSGERRRTRYSRPRAAGRGRRRRPRRTPVPVTACLRAHRGDRRSRRSSGAESASCRLSPSLTPALERPEHGRAGAVPGNRVACSRPRGRARPAGDGLPDSCRDRLDVERSTRTRRLRRPRRAWVPRGDDRRPACHRLDDRHAEPLVERRIHEHRGSR